MTGPNTINASIGKFHAPGMIRELREMLPNAKVSAVDVEGGKIIDVETDMTQFQPPNL